jgi:hypothetical protein
MQYRLILTLRFGEIRLYYNIRFEINKKRFKKQNWNSINYFLLYLNENSGESNNNLKKFVLFLDYFEKTI